MGGVISKPAGDQSQIDDEQEPQIISLLRQSPQPSRTPGDAPVAIQPAPVHMEGSGDNDLKVHDAIVTIINALQAPVPNIKHSAVYSMLSKRLLFPHALLLNNFRRDAAGDDPLKARAVLMETENIIFNLLIDMGVLHDDFSVDQERLGKFVEAMDKIQYDQTVGLAPVMGKLPATSYISRPAGRVMCTFGGTNYAIPITVIEPAHPDLYRQKTVPLMVVEAAATVDSCFRSLSEAEQARFPDIVGELEITLHFMAEAAEPEQQSNWRFDPVGRKHSIDIFFHTQLSQMIRGKGTIVDFKDIFYNKSLAANNFNGWSPEANEQFFKSRQNTDAFLIYVKDVVTHEMGHCLHAILHPLQFRMLGMGDLSFPQSVGTVIAPKSIINLMFKHLGPKIHYAVSNRRETIAELFLFQTNYPKEFEKLPEPDRTMLLEWYLLNGGPQVFPFTPPSHLPTPLSLRQPPPPPPPPPGEELASEEEEEDI